MLLPLTRYWQKGKAIMCNSEQRTEGMPTLPGVGIGFGPVQPVQDAQDDTYWVRVARVAQSGEGWSRPRLLVNPGEVPAAFRLGIVSDQLAFLGRRGGRFAPGYRILGLQPIGGGNLGHGILIPAP